MKGQIRVCGIDDAPFEFGNREAKGLVICTIVRAPSYLEGVLKFDVSVDGTDATERIADALSSSRFLEQLRAIMIDGVALAGFNIVDIQELNGRLRVPVMTVTRDRPDMEAIKSALSQNFIDWEQRFETICRTPLSELPTEHNPIYLGCAGISVEEAARIVRSTTVRGAVPEPIRMAHLIASGIARGESRGKA